MESYKFIDKACYLEEERVLVIADLHLGFEESLIEQGVFLPRFQYKKIREDLEKIFDKLGREKKRVKEVVILGDLKHEFSRALRQEWKETLSLIKFLRKRAGRIIFIKGNHDNYLASILKKEKIRLREFYVKNDSAFLHGHKLYKEVLNKKIKKIFLGHLHPAVCIRRGVKSEVYKCFLVGKWKGKEIIILPSFFPLVEGSDVFIEENNLDKGFNFKLGNFEVYVVVGNKEGEVLDFGKVGANKLARPI